ncbi:MAG: hypothetical protein PF545_01450 [Elusimicrobia bacterium]|jgi:hypothetical protein|nr:hypothetical protein [Elusimicrobiota bacterium]
MIIVKSQNNIPIRLTKERWMHIINRHPEMRGLQDCVLHALSSPDKIQEGDFAALLAIRAFKKLPLNGKYVIRNCRENPVCLHRV